MQLLWSIYVGTMAIFLAWYGIGLFVHYDAFAVFLVAENFAPMFMITILFVVLVWTVDFKLQSHGLLAVDDAYASMWEMAEKNKPKDKNEKITKFFKAKKKNHSINDIMAVLMDDNGFEIFMEHLLHEFKVLFFVVCVYIHKGVVEISQLKQLVKTKFGYVCTCNDKDALTDETLDDGITQNIIQASKREHTTVTVSSWSGSGNSDQESISGMKLKVYPRVEGYRLPSIVPQSGIVFQEVEDFYVVIEALYKKYICSGAIHEVNIGYDLRVIMEDRMAWIEELFHDKHLSHDKKELKKWCYHIFDPVVEEMFTLMEDPFLRFSSTPIRFLFFFLLFFLGGWLFVCFSSKSLTSLVFMYPVHKLKFYCECFFLELLLLFLKSNNNNRFRILAFFFGFFFVLFYFLFVSIFFCHNCVKFVLYKNACEFVSFLKLVDHLE
ncbi:hypothetical protein RFI_15676 [Reticulomyxa filosa]|uniref:RGS domain-containing protein n=1 Tax=Reticulomyxa filosa TaxID=46433 RepID=X6N898_RETFI|nr:hypothetical protein RFI_15676 [Reticulomyxa filosa]|eukprot:ETO21527.1 hypothetical protein RFI_15676 [Reticulomyxa filosa]